MSVKILNGLKNRYSENILKNLDIISWVYQNLTYKAAITKSVITIITVV